MDLKLINGNKEIEEQKKEEKRNFLRKKYYELYLEYLYGFNDNQSDIKASFYGIKYIATIDLKTKTTYQDFLKIQTDIFDINFLLKKLTIKEIMNIYPIEKSFDGKKYEAKDYYSTMDYLFDKNLDVPIGEELFDLFFSYYNKDVINFSVKQFLVIDRLNKFEYKQGLLEGFLDIVDPGKKINTYTLHKKEGYIYNNKTGKTSKLNKVKKRKPKNLNILK